MELKATWQSFSPRSKGLVPRIHSMELKEERRDIQSYRCKDRKNPFNGIERFTYRVLLGARLVSLESIQWN